MSDREEAPSPRHTRASRLRQRNVPQAGQRAQRRGARCGGSFGRGQTPVPVLSTPGPSHTPAPFPALTPIPLSTPAPASAASTKSKKEMTLEEAYPDVFKEPTRANFKQYGQVTSDEFNAMKDIAEFEYCKYFIALGTNKMVFAAIKKTFPNVELDSTTACDLRKHLFERFGDWKYELITNTYGYTFSMIKGFTSQLQVNVDTPEGRSTVVRFFSARIDANLFKNLYGQANCRVLRVDEIFEDRNKAKLCSGPDGTAFEWPGRNLRYSRFVQDVQLRKNVADLFDMMPTNSTYSSVELNQFLWHRYGDDNKKRTAQSAEGAAPKRLASEIADREILGGIPLNLGGLSHAGTPSGSGQRGPLGRDPPSRHGSGPPGSGSSRHSTNFSYDGPYDDLSDMGETDDDDLTERGSLSPTIQLMERSSRYQGAYR
ncbi:hypothetical protein F4859DRAFT_522709 [Xylaria cf. heliscus]|nr:hypothetical protein F4859DRAFT_522709 [Xylaria cf. heliscus]